MKVPTYKKYGLSKREFDDINSRSRKVSNLLTHDIPLFLGIAFGIALWIFTYRKLNPSGFLGTTSQIFVFGTIGLICVGIPMLIFKGAEKLYYSYMKRNSRGFQNAARYEEDREKYDYWRIRRDESYWKLLDGLSFEKETLVVLKKAGYVLKSQFHEGKLKGSSIISKDGEDFILLFRTGQQQTEIPDKIGKTEKAIIVSSKTFSPEFIKKAKNYNVRLISIKELTDLVRTIKE